MRRPCKPERGKKWKKKGRVEEKKREKESADRLFSQAGLFLIVGSTPQLPHANKKGTHMLTHHADLRVCEPFKGDSSEKPHLKAD